MTYELLNEADKMLKDSHDHHFHTVHDHLVGKKVDLNQLWLSVGYFLYGRGRDASFMPWKSEEQRVHLKINTGRKLELIERAIAERFKITLPSSSG